MPRPPEGAPTAGYNVRQLIALDGARDPMGRVDSEAGVAQSDAVLPDAPFASHQLIAKGEARDQMGSVDSEPGADQSDAFLVGIVGTRTVKK